MTLHSPSGAYGNWPLDTADFADHAADTPTGVEAGKHANGDVSVKFTDEFGREWVFRLSAAKAAALGDVITLATDGL